MRKILFILLLAVPVSSSGPKYNFKDPMLVDEFQNVYHDIGNVTKNGIRGVSNGSNACTGCVGEYLYSAVSSLTNFPSSGQYGDLTSLSLTPGDWDVTVTADEDNNGATVTYWGAGVWEYSGNDSTNQLTGQNFGFTLGNGVSGDTFISIPNVRISISVTTTYYLKYVSGYAVAIPKARGRISARRIR